MQKNGPGQTQAQFCQEPNFTAHIDATLSQHMDKITALTTLPDGRVASGSLDGKICFWDTAGTCVATVPAQTHWLGTHTLKVMELTVLPDNRLASVYSDNRIRLWNTSSMDRVKTLVLSANLPWESLTGLTYLRNDLLATGDRSMIHIWNTVKRDPAFTVNIGHAVKALTALPEGGFAIGDRRSIRLWDQVEGRLWGTRWAQVNKFAGHTDDITMLAVLQDGKLASGSKDNTIRVWDLTSGKCESILSGHTNKIYALATLPNNHLASGSKDRTIRVWNVSTGVCEAILKGHTDGVTVLTALPDGRLVSGSKDHAIKFWDLGFRPVNAAVETPTVNLSIREAIAALGVYGPDSTPKKRQAAADALRTAARDKDAKNTIRDAGGITTLVRLLSDSDTGVKQSVAFALRELVSCHAENRVAAAKAGAITLLVHLLGDPDANMRCRAADTLAELISYPTENKVAAAKAGAIALLVRLLKDPDANVRYQATRALSAIVSSHTENKTAVAQAGAIPLLVRLLSDSTVSVRQYAAFALSVLAESHPENQKTVAQAGAIAPLVLLLADPDGYAKLFAMFALKSLATNNPANQTAIVLANALPVLKRLVEQDKDAQRKTNAQEIITLCQSASEKNEADKIKPLDIGIRPVLLPPAVVAPIAAEPMKKEAVKPAPLLPTPSPAKAVPAAVIVPPHAITTSESSEFDSFGSGALSDLPKVLTIASEKVKLGRELGRGGFGTVYEAKYNFQTVAVKRYEGSRLPERVAAEVRHEVSIMLRLEHECLVRFLGLVQIESHPAMLVMEYGANGSLYSFLRSDQEIPWGLRLRLAEELARGLAYLHQEKIVHRDIKSLNVVLDREYHAKWCDFGLAQLKLHSTTTSKADVSASGSVAGTLRWMAPELFSRKNSTPSMPSDIWALGMVFFEIASREIPYSKAMDAEQIKDWIKEAEGEDISKECEEQSPGFARMMQRCWATRNDRPTAETLSEELDVLARTMTAQGSTKKVGSSNAPANAAADSGYAAFSRR